MAGSLQARIKTWVATEDVVYSDLNAEFDNVLLAMQPLLTDDYSANTAQMQVETDPGEVGSESLATTLAGELARLRFMIKELSGETHWYESPPASLNDLVNAIGTGLLDNRIASGRVRTGSQFPIFLVPNGAARTVKADGAPVPLVYYIDGVQYTISTDVTLTGLVAAPSSNNTCLIDDGLALADPEWTKYTGEGGTEITVDAMGSEISALTGKLAAFRLSGASTEYFLAYVKSSTVLSKARRGYFFDSADAPIPRSAYTDNDTITLMKLSWVFAKTDGTLTVTYTNPTWSKDEPSSPAANDYWFDMANEMWKRFDISSFVAADATLIGVCIQDTTNTVAARSFEFFRNWDGQNSIELYPESNSQIKSRTPGAEINVWGVVRRFSHGFLTWDMTADLDSGVAEGSSTYYYFYVNEDGDKIISDIRPYNRTEDLKGYYHPHQSWRCVGYAFNNASSNLTSIVSFFSSTADEAVTPLQTAASRVELIDTLTLLSSAGGAFTKTLPPAEVWRGSILTFMKDNAATDFAAITIDGFASETIGGAANIKLIFPGESIRLMSDGTNIQIVDRFIPKKLHSFTPTGSWSANTTYTGRLQHLTGNIVRFQVKVETAGAPTSSALAVTLPNSWNVSAASLLTGLNASEALTHLPGRGNAHDYSTSTAYSIVARFLGLTPTSIRILVQDASTTNVTEAGLTEAVPFTFAVNDNLEITVDIPIAELDQ